MRMVTINSFLVRIDFFLTDPGKFLEIVGRLNVLIDELYESLRFSDGKLNRTDKQDNAEHLQVKSQNQVQNVQSPRRNQNLIA